MITAKEAKELYDKSGVEVDLFLKNKVEKQVVSAASSGQQQVIIHLGACSLLRHFTDEITPLQKAVVDKLKELGYHTEITINDDPYVPNGLADDNGNGPKYQNYGIRISW